jgi:sorting nexin-1/2
MDVEGSSPWADAAQGSQPGSGSAVTPSKAQASSSSAAGSSRASRLTPRRLVAQPTKLESVEDDPLGPLGAPASVGPPSDSGLPDSPPEPPQKEQSQLPIRTTLPPQLGARRAAPADPHHIDDDDDELDEGQRGPRPPPPVQAAQPSLVRSSTQPSVSIEQAAKPSFHISVGDPAKVGDLTSSHIVYAVRTKV